MRLALLSAAALLVVAAFAFRKDIARSDAATALGLTPPSMAHMSYANPLGDKDFYCLQPDCGDLEGFEGRQTGRLYRNRIDAVLGRPMVTNR